MKATRLVNQRQKNEPVHPEINADLQTVKKENGDVELRITLYGTNKMFAVELNHVERRALIRKLIDPDDNPVIANQEAILHYLENSGEREFIKESAPKFDITQNQSELTFESKMNKDNEIPNLKPKWYAKQIVEEEEKIYAGKDVK